MSATIRWQNYTNTTVASGLTSITVGSTNAANAGGALVEGDILIAAVVFGKGTSGDPGSVAASMEALGFTTLGDEYHTNANPWYWRGWIGWKEVGASEAGTYLASWSVATDTAGWYLGAIRDHNGIDAYAVAFDAALTASHVASSVTATETTDLMLCLFLSSTGNPSLGYPADMTGAVFQTGGAWNTCQMSYGIRQLSASGATGTETAASGSDCSVAKLTITFKKLVASSYETETNALINAMTTLPSVAIRTAMDTCIGSLKTAGVWAKLDRLYLFATDVQDNALFNWVDSSVLAVAYGTPTFDADQGFTAASDKYINLSFNPSTQGVQYTQNSAHLAAWSLGPAGGSYNPIIQTEVSTSTTCHEYLVPYATGTGMQACINDTSQDTVASITDGRGFFAVVRDASNRKMYANGVAQTGNADTRASVAVNNLPMVSSGDYTNNGTGNNSVWKMAMLSAGATLTAQNVTDFYNAIKTYLKTIGTFSIIPTASSLGTGVGPFTITGTDVAGDSESVVVSCSSDYATANSEVWRAFDGGTTYYWRSATAAAWASGTTYNKGGQAISNSLIYTSLVDSNVGNDPTTDGGVHWKQGNWLDIDFGADASKSIVNYRMTGTTTANVYPKTWSLYGSNAGTFTGEETLLDTRTGVAAWAANEKRLYTLAEPSDGYRYFRLHITVAQGTAATNMRVVEFELDGLDYTAPPSEETNISVSDYLLDFGIDKLRTECDAIYICSAAPTSYSDATTNIVSGGHACGHKTFGAGSTFGSPADATPNGRKVTSNAITDGSITNDSSGVAYWAAVDTSNSRLLAWGPVTGSVAVTNGKGFTLDAIVVHQPSQ